MSEYLKSFKIRGREMRFPIYLPDATRAVTRGLDAKDLESVGIEALVVNTYHLMRDPGMELIRKAGGVQKFMRWNGFAVSDSGGFQLLSLIYEGKVQGRVEDAGAVFYEGVHRKKRRMFTPEQSVQVQFDLGTDIVVCFDDCMYVSDDRALYERAVRRTVEWAKQCKEEFEKQIAVRGVPDSERPLLLAVNQGGLFPDLRERCGRELADIGFDGYGWGGWSIDPKTKKLDMGIAKIIADTMPDNKPKFALGVGTPNDIATCFGLGYTIFDCVLPTRDARHQRLYVFPKDPATIDWKAGESVCEYLHLEKERYTSDFAPISEWCDCPACTEYSRAYLHHLFRIKETLAFRLATMHNLRTYTKLIGLLRKSLEA